LAAVCFAACAVPENDPLDDGGSGGTSPTGQGGSTGTAGAPSAKGGSTGTAGSTGVAGSSHGGSTGVAGSGHGGATASEGGSTGAEGGSTGVAGSPGKGGSSGVAGAPGKGGSTGIAGSPGKGGSTGVAGSPGTGGSTGTGGAASVNCDAPSLTGGTQINSSNKTGTAAGLSYAIWSNGSGGSITVYDTPAFKATWNNSGDFLARLGLQWNASKTFDQYGTITAQFAEKKTGNGGGYSYIGIYGWSVSPCVEFYIVDDSYNGLPFNPGQTTNKGTLTIDGGDYILYSRNTTGTGGSKCSGVSSWAQYYSMRKTKRTCGQISVTEHFKAWAAAGMPLGKMDQVQILLEVGGGSGSAEFTTANVTTTQ
jgi:hypothetical protein